MKSFLGSCKLLTFYIKSILPVYVFFWNPAKHILIFDILPSPQFHTSRLKRIITIPFIKVLFCIFSSILDFSHLVLTIRYYIYSAQILNFCHERKFKIVNPPWYTTLLAWSPKKSSISYIHVAIYYDDCDYLHTIFTMYLLYTTQNFVFWVNISSKNSFFSSLKMIIWMTTDLLYYLFLWEIWLFVLSLHVLVAHIWIRNTYIQLHINIKESNHLLLFDGRSLLILHQHSIWKVLDNWRLFRLTLFIFLWSKLC